MAPTVTLVTTRAQSADDLTDQDYRDIYSEIRSRMSLRAFVAIVHSGYTIGYWSKWENSPDLVLTRQARNELRAAVNLPVLPPTVAEALQQVDPNAAVYHVGADRPDRLVMVGADVPAVTLRLNGSLTVGDGEPVSASLVSPDTPRRSRPPTKAVRFSPATFDRLATLRRDAGLSWDEFGDWIATLCGA